MPQLDYIPPPNLQELLETDPWWKSVSEEVDRVYSVQHLPSYITDRHKHGVVESLFEGTEITDEKLSTARAHPVFEEAKELIQGLKQGDAFPTRLTELFLSRIPTALDQIDERAGKLLALLENQHCAQKLKSSWPPTKKAFPSYRGLIQEFGIKDVEERFIVRRITELADLRRYVEKLGYPFNEEDYLPAEMGEGEERRDRVEYLAYRVFDPLWVSGIEEFESEYMSFPLHWAGSLFTITTMKRLYAAHKAGTDVVAKLVPYFLKAELDPLQNAISMCPITARHGDLFLEIASSFRSGMFKVASRSLLAMIEGMVWDFAWWWNQHSGTVFDKGIGWEKYNGGDVYLLNNRDGSQINADATIGLLLRNTTFGEEFSFEFIEYFCEELFQERNPVLHGRFPNYGDDKKAGVLLLVVRVLEKNITGAFAAWFAKEAIGSYEKAKAKGTVL
jgi:hypothetical protein